MAVRTRYLEKHIDLTCAVRNFDFNPSQIRNQSLIFSTSAGSGTLEVQIDAYPYVAEVDKRNLQVAYTGCSAGEQAGDQKIHGL